MLKKPKIQHHFLKEGFALEQMEFTPEERGVHLSNLREWHNATPGFGQFLQNLEKTGFWNNLNRMPMPELIDYMLEDRHFKGEAEQHYLNKIKEILTKENKMIIKIKEEKNQQKRLELITREIFYKLIDGEYLEAEILHLFHTAEAGNLEYLPD